MQFFFHENDQDPNSLASRLESACDGLIYISETDTPITPFGGGPASEITSQIILEQTGRPPDEPVEERDFDEFFDRLTTDQGMVWRGRKGEGKKIPRAVHTAQGISSRSESFQDRPYPVRDLCRRSDQECRLGRCIDSRSRNINYFLETLLAPLVFRSTLDGSPI